VQRLLESVSPTHGRILIYVWAIEQDELSKRSVPVGMSTVTATGQDVFVPWVRSESRDSAAQPQVFNRYYHMFAQDEILVLVREAARSLGLLVTAPSIAETHGVEVVQHGWERSNHYVELRRWTK
jgi:tRNA (uracil-5-)-methyltransferase TRM9